jgi:hypothetical protein
LYNLYNIRTCVIVQSNVLQVFNDDVDFFGMLFPICTSGRRRMWYTNVEHGFVCMVSRFVHGMRTFINFVCQNVGGTSGKMFALKTKEGSTMRVFSYQLLLWRF